MNCNDKSLKDNSYEITLFYATNRNYLGKNQWKPKGYGKSFSSDGHENLRFGELETTIVNKDIWQSIQGIAFDHPERNRKRNSQSREWEMT